VVLPESVTRPRIQWKGIDPRRARYVDGCRSIGVETVGAAAPLEEMWKKFGFTSENITAVATYKAAEAR
jgi:transketolase